MRNKNSLSLLMERVKEYGLLEEHQANKYIKMAQEGDLEARNKMITHNIRLVVNIAKDYADRGVELEDLIQEGVEGLIIAIEKFEIERGNKFSTYAFQWIRQRVYKMVQDKSRTIRVPVYIHEIINKVSRAREKFLIEGKDNPSTKEIADYIDVEERKVKIAMKHLKMNLSLEYEKDRSDFTNLIEQKTFIEPETKFAESQFVSDRNKTIFDALETLSDRQQKVLIYRYGLDQKDEDGFSKMRTLKEVSDIIGISKERIRQLEKKALETLREGGGRTNRRRRLREFV
ncbi:RNA polymerase sigma factor RpoD/SigA [Bacillus mexicanus]|uniref:sigma-70 family RNA polymerase sigma factor n=1 Tax=Bacillus mexicanus TaxID=2834415 RepID=UPI003D1B4A9E